MTIKAKPLPPAVILAGGRAIRMGGREKCLLQLGGQKILSHVIARLAPQVSQIALNANGNPKRFSDFNYPVIPDSIAGFVGPLAGVLAGMDWAASIGQTEIISVASDTPFFPKDLVQRLREKADITCFPLVLAAENHPTKGRIRHPTFGLWPIELREDLRSSLQSGLRKIVHWTDRHKGHCVDFATKEGRAFFNVNTPEDLIAAETLL
ncbi:MAG: molybdenum cofactor guanylyltransferase MobA [Aestuariivita sp.]|nr:molybdenum cofactor guanylyltransferase MobA [Aestuariivita sp.]MCY4345447.1 molybdenum cofactor guanylyltransferase MobA [Aestuariivita sp.]